MTLMKEKIRAHIFVAGKVQGVFFRWETQKAAQVLGLFGWARNLDDGRVEITAEGEKEKVEKLIEWARHGPVLATVASLEINREDFKNEFDRFEITA